MLFSSRSPRCFDHLYIILLVSHLSFTCTHTHTHTHTHALYSQCLPYMIAMSTDADPAIKIKADQQLSDHTGRYGHIAQVIYMDLGGASKLMFSRNLNAIQCVCGGCCFWFAQTHLMRGVKKSFEYQRLVSGVSPCVCVCVYVGGVYACVHVCS